MFRHLTCILYIVIALGALTFTSCKHQPAAVAGQEIVDSIRQPSFPELVIDVHPKADYREDALSMLQQAIDDCSRRGGGHVNVKRGKYHLCGSLVLKSNVDLHLEMGSNLQFSGVASDFLPEVHTRWEGTECMNYSPMIYAEGCTNLAITGHGTIDAQASLEMTAWASYDNDLEDADGQLLHQMAEDQVPFEERPLGRDMHLRPSMIQFNGCSSVLVEDVRIVESPFWTIHPLYCHDVVIRNVTIESFYRNNDGVVAESSSDVLIEHCVFNTGDDSVDIKAGRNAEGRRIGRPSRNIVIRDCIFSSEANGLCIGSEVSGGIENVFVDNVRIEDVRNAIYFKSNSDRGGYIHNINIDNVEVTHAKLSVVRIETDFYDYGNGGYPSEFADFHIANVNVHSSDYYGIYIDGQDNNHVKDVVIRNFDIGRAKIPYYVYNSDHVAFDNVVVAEDLMPKEPVPAVERQLFEPERK